MKRYFTVAELEKLIADKKTELFFNDLVGQYIWFPEETDNTDKIKEKVSNIKKIIKGLKKMVLAEKELRRGKSTLTRTIEIKSKGVVSRYINIAYRGVYIYTNNEIKEDFTLEDIIEFLKCEAKRGEEIVFLRENIIIKNKKIKKIMKKYN